MPKKSGVKKSTFSRSLSLLGMASKVAGQELKQKIKETWNDLPESKLKSRIDQARVIAENLSQLKGAAMKAGQLLSLDVADYFPPEEVEVLTNLQANADPVDFKIIEKVLKKELGPKFKEIKELDPVPAASASIGQVHRAKINGRDLAIKVQYPGVKESIDSDIAVIEKVAKGFLTITAKKINLEEAFEELRIVLKAEAYYKNELRNMQEYRDHLKNDSRYIVPEAIPEFSTERVLVMSWEKGLRIQDWLKTNPSLKDRESIGRLVLELYNREFYEWGFVQTDPNYANFLVQENPLRLVVLDFGATLRYSSEFRKEYKKLLEAMGSGEPKRTLKTAIDWGLLDPHESEETKANFVEMLKVAMEPFNPKLQPFKFADQDYARRTREVNQKFAMSLKYTPPPRQLFFLHRKLGGIFTLLKRMEVRLDLLPYWKETVGTELGL